MVLYKKTFDSTYSFFSQETRTTNVAKKTDLVWIRARCRLVKVSSLYTRYQMYDTLSGGSPARRLEDKATSSDSASVGIVLSPTCFHNTVLCSHKRHNVLL